MWHTKFQPLPVLSLIGMLAHLLGAGNSSAGDPEGSGAAYPTRPISIMAPAAPGGGWDQTARAMQAALTKSTGRRAVVYNSPGAGGTIGLARFASDHRRDPHQMLVGGLVMLGATEINRSPVTLDQVTPVATLTAEWQAVVVPAGSKCNTLGELLADFKANPSSVVWCGGSAGGSDHILVGLIARQAGVDPAEVTYVAYPGGGEALVALLSGAVTAGVSGVSETREQVEAGRLRRLAVSSRDRIPGVDAPTLREAGLDVSLANWRGVWAAPDVTDEQRDAVVAELRRMRDTEEWQEALRRHGWDDFFKTGDELSAFLAQEQRRVREVTAGLRRGGRGAVGPYFFPAVVGVALAALAVTALLRAFVCRRTVRDTPAAEDSPPPRWGPVGLTSLALLVYAFALTPLGYVAATSLFFPAVAHVLGSRRPVRDLLLGVALAVVIYLALTRLLGVRLPGGVLDGLHLVGSTVRRGWKSSSI